VVDRLRIDPATLHAINPRLVICNMTGYGRKGPEANRRAVDPIIQSLAGAMSITGLPGSAPVRAGVATGDLSTGLYAAIGVLAALHARSTTGQGSCVETSLFHSQLSLLNYVASYCAWSGEIPSPVGSGHPGTVPSQTFATLDGWLTIDAGFDRHFRTLCEVIGHTELADDPRFRDRQSRARHRGELVPAIEAEIARRSTSHWVQTLDEAGIPCGRVNNVQEAIRSPQSQAYGSLRTLEYRGRPVEVLATPLWFDDDVTHPMASPPELGQDTAEVLRTLLGYDDDAIARVAGANGAMHERDRSAASAANRQPA
jgi:crotonobetainyl-CoA:carnitine CoA-transferase CaiB-like acyl-CoA transferase